MTNGRRAGAGGRGPGAGGRWPFGLFFCYLCAAGLFPAAGRGQTNPAAGYVLKCSGVWTANQNGQDRPLKAGAVVNPGDKLRSNPADAVLGLVLYDGTYLKCGRPGAGAAAAKCQQPIQVPAQVQTRSTFAAFLEKLENRQLPPVAFVTSRAAGSADPPVELRDAVLAGGGSRLDLSHALSGAPPVELHFYLEPLDAPAGCGAAMFTLAAGALAAPAGDLAPRCNGLYKLSATDESMEAAYPATVLLVAANQRERASRMLDEAVRVTTQWESAGEDEKRTFLRLTLGGIQQSIQAAK